MRYFVEGAGKIFAILNHKYRKTDDDAVVAMQLRGRARERYEEMKQRGARDSVIFRRLFPRDLPEPGGTPSAKVSIEIKRLNKSQLVHMILEETHLSMPSLPRLSMRDLRKLLLALRKLRDG